MNAEPHNVPLEERKGLSKGIGWLGGKGMHTDLLVLLRF